MYTLTLENKLGSKMTLTGNESNYQVLSVSGLNQPQANINTHTNAYSDGSVFNSSHLVERNVVINVKINGDIEKNRLKLYEFASTAQYCKIYFESEHRNIYCEGYVENADNDPFSNSNAVQISVLCNDPYLYAIGLITADISNRVNCYKFPLNFPKQGIKMAQLVSNRKTRVVNFGEVDTGLIITLTADEFIENPVIYNEDTGEFFKLKNTLAYGESIVIDTRRGKKSVKKYIDGTEYNIIGSLVYGSTWHQLKVGANNFVYSADSNPNNLYVTFSYNNLYKGI